MHHLKKTAKASSQEKVLKNSSVLRSLLAATLSISGAWQLLPPLALAQLVAPLTPAGTGIKNTATGTYEDPNTPGVRINATSNEVTATVAEVVGVTNVPAGIVDVNGGSVTTNDVVNYDFLITNVGNDLTAINIPGTATLVGANPLGFIVVTEINGIVLTTPIDIPGGGIATNDTGFINLVRNRGIPSFDGTIAPNSTIRVRVPVTVTQTVAGLPVSVQLGNTGSNDNTAGTQNQIQSSTLPATLAGDVYTINPATGLIVPGGVPVNGVREAAAFTTVPLATQVNNLALATVLKTRTAYNAGLASLTDDTLTYRLDLRVESTPPTGSVGITPAPLQATSIQLDGALANKILVSDAIPVGTTLDQTFAPATITINGITWTKVYSKTVTTTSPLAVAANWRTTVGALSLTGAEQITRVGYIADGPLPAGSTTATDASGLQFRVITTGVNALPVSINNIAQVFGQTQPNGAGSVPISATNPLVYDESGDQNPNNFEAGTAPAAIIAPGTSPNGIADISTQETDSGNNNSGTGAGGEVNTFPINPVGIILNGPPGQPAALGPDGTSLTDFVNKSATDVPTGTAGVPGSVYNPAEIVFTNTVANPGSNTAQLDNVTLEPISALLAAQAVANNVSPTALTLEKYTSSLVANHAVLQNGTIVKISFGGRTAVYTLTSGEFVLSTSGPNVAGTGDTLPAPIIIPSIPVGTPQNYTVTVDLPANSLVTTGYSVPIVAYVNSNTGDGSTFKRNAANALTLTQDNPFNIKIDRVYTGYLDLRKQSRILNAAGTELVPFSTADKPAVEPGNIIEYLVSFKNISLPPTGGSANVILNANNIIITEDGAALPNNWATTTLNVPSTARVDQNAAGATVPTYSAVITFFTGATPSTTTDTAVTKYLDTIPTLAPSETGFFRFQRRVK